MTFSVLRRIEETALAHGDLIAMEEGDRRLSYAGLVECIRHVGRQGLAMPGPGLVGINGRPSIEAGVGILAAMASGDVAVPVDARLPPARQQALLDWCDVAQDRGAVSAILADPAGGTKGPGAAASVVAARTERQPAYVTFTSGTTGEPKAIEGTMEGIDHFMAWQSQLVGAWIDRPRVSWLTPLSFDVMYRDLLLPLCTQGTLVIPHSGSGFNIASGWNWLIGQDIDIAHVVPSIMGAWLAGGDLPPLPAAALFFAGEPLKRHLVDDLKPRYAGRIYNLYGPSETTMAKFCRRVDDGCPTRGGLYPVGRPIDEAVTYTVSGEGEVIIRSPFLTNGYRKKDGTVTPFSAASPGWRSYPTGDRGEVIDGELYLLGRIDGQMKVNGIRIEAGEVERLAESCVGVARAVVVKLAPPEAPLETLALFHQGDKACEATLRAHLADNLHPAIVPTFYAALASFPVTINGKVDRKALAALAIGRLAAPCNAKAGGASSSEAASHVQAVISKVLRRPCGLDTDFVPRPQLAEGHAVEQDGLRSRPRLMTMPCRPTSPVMGASGWRMGPARLRGQVRCPRPQRWQRAAGRKVFVIAAGTGIVGRQHRRDITIAVEHFAQVGRACEYVVAWLVGIEADIRGMAPGQRLSARQAHTAPLSPPLATGCKCNASGLRQVPSRREACLHPSSLGRFANLPRRRPCRDR